LLPVPVQYVFPVAFGQARTPQSPDPQPSTMQSQAFVQVTLLQPPVLQVTRQRPAPETPQVMSLQAAEPEQVIRQSAVPQVMLLQASPPVHITVHDAAPVQLMLLQSPPVHVMSQCLPDGQVTLSPPAPLIVQVGGFAVVSQPPLQTLGHASLSMTQ
jgi:hypothetical protein